MPRINQLPAASSVASTDVVAIDTQDKTYRVPKSTLFDGYYTAAEVDEAVAQSTANIGSIYYESSGEKSVAFTNKTKAICSLTLPAGTYVITGQCCFYGCTESTRQGITFSLGDDTDGKFDTMAYTLQTKPETTTSNQWYNITRIAQLTSTTVVYLMGFDTTVTRTILSNIRAVRIK